jgi:Leucine-rich repeat (LRR) protein
LNGTIPSSIGELTGLNHVFLPHNELNGTIPSSIGELTGLSTMSLENNELTGRIPSEMAKLKALTELFLDCNKLTGIVPSLPFEQYGTVCALDILEGNHFKCPLPPNSDKCLYGAGAGVHCK